jgi:hypothetical protein
MWVETLNLWGSTIVAVVFVVVMVMALIRGET